jgi:hypothetical protein
MKYFTHPKGIFEIKIPLDWYYKNQVAGFEDESPFSFEPFEDSPGCFQISCYNKSGNEIHSSFPKHVTALVGVFTNKSIDQQFSVHRPCWCFHQQEYID